LSQKSRKPKLQQGSSSQVWRFFCSVKLTLLLLLLITVGSVAGTLIQQNLPKEEYFRVWMPGTATFLMRSGLTDVYHSWWFLGLMLVLAINLITCSLDRYPSILAAYRGQPDLPPESLKAQTFHRTLVVPGTLEDSQAKAQDALRRVFHTPSQVQPGKGGTMVYLTKGAFARWGVLVVHASLLVIFLGVIIGSIWGYKAFVNVVEGTSTREVLLRGSADDEHEHRIAIPFELRVDTFKVAHYDSGQPKDFVSHVKVLDEGRVVIEKDLRVNDPLSYRGLTFYQSNYGPAPEATLVLEHGGTHAQLRTTLSLGESQVLPGNVGLAFDGFAEDHNHLGPAIQLRLQSPGGEPQQVLLFQQNPEFDRQRGDAWFLKIADLKLKQYTGLQVAKDPGVGWVWAGCALMMLGMVGAFFSSHRQVWIRLEARKDGVAWTLAGSTSRNKLAFEKEFQALVERIET